MTPDTRSLSSRLVEMNEPDAPLPEALALAQVLDAATRGDLLEMNCAKEAIAHVASMLGDRIGKAMAEIDAIRLASEQGAQA